MMNVVNSAVASKADTASANSSTSGKGARSTGDDGFAKTLNSYGDGQGAGSKTADAGNGGGATSAGQSGQAKTGADTAADQTNGSAGKSAVATQSALAQAVAAQNGQATDPTAIDAAVELPVDGQSPQQAVATNVTDANLGAATDLLADLQAAIPAATKGQTPPVRTASGDQSKTDKTDATSDATDTTTTKDAATGDMLAILQVMPDVAGVQAGAAAAQQSAQPQANGIEIKINTDALASRSSGTSLPQQAQGASDTADTATTTPVVPDGARTSKATPSTDATASAHDASQHEDDNAANLEMPAVTVTDSRRYVGLAPSTNAMSLATTFGKDPDWSAAMDPSAKLSNEALYASTGKVVNTLKIELSPGDLGHVTATMRMVGEELSIHLTVENSKAYKQITSDSSSMLDNLKAHGYSVDQITVSIASSSSSTSSDKGNDSSASGRQASDMGQAQQQQQQSSRQGGGFSRNMPDAPEINLRGSASGGTDESLAKGNAVGRTDSRPDHVYL
jgi:chemotaxis protein MotD